MKKPTSKSEKRAPGARPIAVSKFRSYALYGRSGTGKTTFACTFPKRILLLDIRDEGTDSVSDVEGVDAVEIDEWTQVEDQYWWLKDNPGVYKTVIIDTISQMQELAIQEVIGERGRKGKRAGDWGSMTRQDFGAVTNQLNEWIINFRNLTKDDYNVVFIAQDRVFNVDDEGASEDDQILPEVGPALMPSVAKKLNAAVSVIGNTFIGEKLIKKEVGGKKKTITRLEYRLGIGPSSVYTRKIRKPKSIEVPSYLVDATYDDIQSIIKGE